MADSPQQPGWRLRTLRTADEPGVVELLERGFDRPLAASTWRWKTARRLSTAPNVFLAVDGNDRPIFHYAGMHRRLDVRGARRDVMVAVDGVTDPLHRRRGLLTAGARHAHQRWSEAGVDYVLGLPNEQWGSRIEALDWRPLVALKWRIRPLRPELLLARRLRIPALGKLTLPGRLWNLLWGVSRGSSSEGVSTADIDDFGREFEDLPKNDPDTIALHRDAAWLRWRYLACPQHDYRVLAAHRCGDREAADLVGYAVYRLADDGRIGYVAEVVTVPASEQVRRALIAAVVQRLSALGASAVAALASPGGDLHRSLLRSGFLYSWGEFTVHCVALAQPPTEAVLGDPGRWRLQGGDFDVV